MSAPRKHHKIRVTLTPISVAQARIRWDVNCPDHLLQIYLEMLAKAVNDTLAEAKKRESAAVKAWNERGRK